MAFNLQVGDIVHFATAERGIETASLGLRGMVFHLNCVPVLRCEVMSVETLGSGLPWICLRPDGWPFPTGVWPAGFYTTDSRISFPSADDSTNRSGVVVDDAGRVVPAEAVHEAVISILKTEGDWRIDGDRWEILKAYEQQTGLSRAV